MDRMLRKMEKKNRMQSELIINQINPAKWHMLEFTTGIFFLNKNTPRDEPGVFIIFTQCAQKCYFRTTSRERTASLSIEG